MPTLPPTSDIPHPTSHIPLLVDLHTHILPPTWPDLRARYGYPGWISLDPCTHPEHCCARMLRDNDGSHFRTVQSNCFNPIARIDDLSRLLAPILTQIRGLRQSSHPTSDTPHPTSDWLQVLSTVPVMFSYWAKPQDGLDLSRFLNDHIAQVCRDFPHHFAGLGTIPLQDPDSACRELERCIRDLNLRGVQIGTHVEPNPFTNRTHDWNLSDPALFPVFQTAADLNAAIFIHPWDMMGSAQMQRYWLPWLVGMPAESSRAICSVLFSGLLDRLPNLRLCFAHGGGAFPGTIGRIDHAYHVRPDLCATDSPISPRSYLARSGGPEGKPWDTLPARFYVDSLVHDPDALRTLLTLFTPQRIALGSDYPFPLGELSPGSMIASMPDLSPAARAQLLHRTALEFLGLDPVQAAANPSELRPTSG